MAQQNELNLNANFKPIMDSIDKLIASIDKLDTRLDSLTKEASTIDKVFGDTKALDEFIASINKLNSAAAVGFGSLVRGLSQLSNALKDFPTDFNNAGLREFVDNIFDLLLTASSLNFNFSKDQISGLNALGRFFQSITSLSLVDINKFRIDPETIGSIRLLIDSLSGIPSNAQKQLGFFDSVMKGVQDLFQANVGNAGNQNMEIISQSLLAFSRAIKNLNKEIAEVDVKQILKVFTGLSGGLQIVSFVLSKLPGIEQVENFSKVFQRLGIGLSGIARGAEALDVATVIKLSKSLAVLGGTIKIISSIVRLGGDKNAESFSRIVASTVSALVDLNRLASIRNQQRSSVDFGQQIELVTKIIRAFSSLKGAKIPDIGGTIKGIADAFQVLSVNVNIDQKAIVNFEKFVDRMVKSIVKLNSVDIDTRKAIAIGQQVEALTRLNNVEGQLKSLNQTLSFAAFLTAVPAVLQGINAIVNAFNRIDDVVIEAVRRAGQEFRTLGTDLIDVGQRVLSTFSLKTLTESGAFDIATEFDRLTNQLEVFGRLTEEELASATAFADQIGIKYPLSANDALKATLDLTKAGQDLNSVFQILPNAADLAALSDTQSIETTTQALIAAEGAFREFANGVEGSFENIDVAANILAAGADVSTASIESLSQGLANAATAADQAGLTYEQTVAALAILDQAQLKAAEGGTALRSALNAIFQRDQAREEFAALGIAIENADGTIRDFDSILKDLNKRFANFTEAQIVSSLGNIADTYGRTALSILITNNGLSDTIDAMDETGTAADRAQKLLDNFRGDLDQLSGSVETALKNIFLPLIERAFRPLVQLLRQVVDGFLALPESVQQTAGMFLLLVSTATTLIGSLSVLSGGLLKISGLFLSFAGNLLAVVTNIQSVIFYVGALGTSLAVIVPAIIALTGGLLFVAEQINTAFRLVAENVGGAGDAFNLLRKTVESTFGEIARIVTTFVQAVQFGFDEIFGLSDEERGRGLASTFDTISDSIAGFLDTLRQIDTGAIVRFFLIVKSQITRFVEDVQNVISAVTKNVGDFIGPIRKAIEELLPEIGRFVTNVVNLFSGIGAETKDIPIVETLTEIIRFIRKFVTDQIKSITDLLNFLSTNVLEPLAQNIPIIVNGIERFVGTLLKIFKPLIDFVATQGGIVIEFLQSIPELLNDLGNAGNVVGSFAQRFIEGLLTLPSAVGNVLERIGLTIGSELLFFLGKGLTTGNFSALTNVIGTAIQQFLRSIPSFFIRIGEESGNIFLKNFGQSLLGTDVGTIITSFFQLVESTIVSGVGALLNFLTDLGRSVLQSLFPVSEVQNASNNIISVVNSILDLIAAPLRTALQIFARGLDFASIALEIATSLIENIVNQILSLLPNALIIIADSVEDETIAALLRGFGNAVKTLVDSLTSLLALPLQTLASAFGAFSSFLDLLEKIGVTRGASTAIIAALTLSLTGLGNALVDFGRKITIQFLQPTIIAIQSLLFQIRSLAAPLIAQAKTAIISFFTGLKNAVSSAFIASVRSGTSVISGGFNSIFLSLRNLASISFSTIVSGIRSIGTSLRALANAAAPFILITAAITALQAALDAFSDAVDNGPLSGILKFFENISVSVLNLLGLEQLVPQVQENFRLLEIIVGHFAKQVEQALTVAFLNILQGFSDLRARLEQASADLGLTAESRFAQQFFAVGETLRTAGELSGQEFFKGLGETLRSPEDLNALKTQLIPFKQTIIDEFKSLDFSEIVKTDFLAASDIVNTIVQADALPDAFRALEGDLAQLLDFGIALRNLNPEAASDNIADFLNSALAAGLTDSDLFNERVRRNFRDLIIQAMEAGDLSTDDAARFLDAIGFSNDAISAAAGELGVRFEVLSSTMSELFSEVQNSNLEQLRQQLEDGKISADEYQAALAELGNEIVNTMQALEDDKVAALTRQFREGVISEQEYRTELEAINEQSRQATLTALESEIARITLAAQEGAISFEEAAVQINAVQESIKEVNAASPKLEQDLTKLSADLAAGKITAQQFAQEYERITKAIEDAKKAATGGVDSTVPTVSGETSSSTFAPPVEAQEEFNKLLEEEEKLKEKIADFDKDEARRLEDDLREEQKKRDDIEEIRRDADQKAKDDLVDFNIDRQRAEQDHQRRLTEIARSANQQFEDAIAGRDSAAAQAAQQQLTEQKRQENEQFKLDEQRAKEDFALDQQRAQRDRDLRLQEAQIELQDLIDKNARERARRLEDYNIEIAELQAKINAERNLTQQANLAEEVAEQQHQIKLFNTIQQGMVRIQGAVAGGLPGVANLFTSFFQQMVNGISASFAASQAMFQARQTGTVPPPRAQGGSVKAGGAYRIEDGENPEVARIGNKTYLLANKNGQITPIQPVQQQRLAGAGAGINISLDIGGINIQGAQGNPETLAAAIEKRILDNTVDAVKAIVEKNRRI